MAIKRNLKLKKPQLRKPSTAPIDVVRNPNFPAALAQQEYQNSIADFRARMLAEQNAANALGVKYIATLGTSNAMQTDGGQDFIDSRDPNKNYTMNMVDYIDPATGEVTSRTSGINPAPGSRFVRYYGPSPQGPGGDMVGFVPVSGQLPPQGPQQGFGIDYIEGGQRNAPMTPTPSQMAQFRNAQQGAMAGMQNNPSIYDSLRPPEAGINPVRNTIGIAGQQFGQFPSGGLGNLMPQNPQGQQQMQSYQNFLNQGMNNMASVNQGAAANFANTQPGIPTTGSAQQPNANPAMPVAGMGARKLMPTPRKFSTVSNQPARFA